MIGDSTNIDSMYKDYKVLKKPAHYEYDKKGIARWVPDKYRKISAPIEELKAEQRRILKEELSNIPIHDNAYGFIGGKNIFDNASAHLGAESLLEVDLKDFFDTISAKRVFHALKRDGVGERKAQYICKIATRFGFTPQGAPTSPMLTNIVCRPMDNYLSYIADKYGCRYTRYADDITFSGAHETMKEIQPRVIHAIHRFGLTVNGSKIHIIHKTGCMRVTGIIVNKGDELSVSYRKSVQDFKALLHNAEKALLDKTVHTPEEFETRFGSASSLKGYANFISTANQRYKKYYDQVCRIEKLLKEMK